MRAMRKKVLRLADIEGFATVGSNERAGTKRHELTGLNLRRERRAAQQHQTLAVHEHSRNEGASEGNSRVKLSR